MSGAFSLGLWPRSDFRDRLITEHLWFEARKLTSGFFFLALALGLTWSCTREPGVSDRLPAVRPAPAASPGAASTGADESARQREEMVEELRGMFKDLREFAGMPAALEAMRRVPRHEFVHPKLRSRAYDVHSPLPIEEEQTISAPDIVAIMTGALDLKEAKKVLEIGTGSGYQAAVLGELVSEVYTIEIRPGLAEAARRKIEDLKKRGILRAGKIQVIVGDGYQGYAPMAPYDAIMVTAAPKEVPVELLNQLKVGGRMAIPVGDYYQQLQLIERKPDGSFSHRMLLPVRFVPMVKDQEAKPVK
ncbi:MAG: protein-L-isoaspartate(D-aspartate) O-methyltransferase [Planctomycetes bacterium]|nr:protein-L-isoaspartate(D-aspartate) O-methyltransferase [Planctomycetota bacterium]